MGREKKSWESSFLKWFLSLLFVAFLINIGVLVLIHEEPRRGIITFEMLKSHNFLQPTVLGVPYFKKPPLHEWITSFFSVLTGEVSEFSLRIPSSISVILTSLVMYLSVKSLFNSRVALFSSLIYSTFYLVLIGYGSKCEPDTLFSFFVTLSTFCWFYLFEKRKEFWGWFWGYLFTSFALLTKGLPAVQFFYFFVFSYLFMKKKIGKLFTLSHLFGFLLGIAPFLLWLSSIRTEQAIETLFSEVISRAPGEVPLLKTVKNYATYPLRFVAATFPWSFLFIYYLLRRKRRLEFSSDTNLQVLLLAFALDVILYWVFPGSRLRYLMPALPLFAVFLGYFFSDYQVLHKRAKEIVKFSSEIIVPLAIVVGVIVTRNPSLILQSTVEFLIFLYVVYFVFIPRFNFTYVVVLISILMLMLRGFYSSYYYPVAEYKYPPVRKVASEIVKDSSSYGLFTKTTYLQLCFYVERGRDAILRFTKTPPPNALFLTQRREGHVLKSYRLGKHTFYLCSYGVSFLRPQGNGEEQKKHYHEGRSHSKGRVGSPEG